MLDGASGVLIAVSGGPDSVVLLDMLLRLSVREPAKSSTKPRFHVAHLDHMLRERESAEDAEFVRELATELGLRVTTKAIDVQAAAQRCGRGVEEVAREIRYNFLRSTAADTGCDRIAVGHTMTDQAETVLMRLIRGAGTRGLAGMRPVSPVPSGRRGEWKRGRSGEGETGGRSEGACPKRQAIEQNAEHVSQSPPRAVAPTPPFPRSPSPLLIRPLLCITREEVQAYCGERGLRFRTDATNLSLHYTRNRIRSTVLPALSKINPRIVEAISRATSNTAADQDVLDDLALSLLVKARVPADAWFGDGPIAAYSIKSVKEQSEGMRRRIIGEAIRLARSTLAPRETEFGSEIGSVHVEAVVALLTEGTSGKRVGLPGLLEVWRDYDTLVFRRTRNVEAPQLVTISVEQPAVEAGGFAFVLERGLPVELIGKLVEGVKEDMQTTKRNWMSVALDDLTLPHELVLRPRVRGERALVIGQRRTIKLKNLMIDHRIPSSRRSTWPLLTTPDGAYIWSPGLPPAVEFAAHDETRSLATVRASAI